MFIPTMNSDDSELCYRPTLRFRWAKKERPEGTRMVLQQLFIAPGSIYLNNPDSYWEDVPEVNVAE